MVKKIRSTAISHFAVSHLPLFSDSISQLADRRDRKSFGKTMWPEHCQGPSKVAFINKEEPASMAETGPHRISFCAGQFKLKLITSMTGGATSCQAHKTGGVQE